MHIRAGTVDEISWNSGEWIFLDIGFSGTKPTCGLLFGKREPKNVRFNDACKEIIEFVALSSDPVNLVIEAPLSVAFNFEGNPTGRSVEKERGKRPRYWYLQGGCGVMVAAQYLVSAVSELDAEAEVRLFEGFVSFKPHATDHSEDVVLLREVVEHPLDFTTAIVAPEKLAQRHDDCVQSAFVVCGNDYGVPPVIKRDI